MEKSWRHSANPNRHDTHNVTAGPHSRDRQTDRQAGRGNFAAGLQPETPDLPLSFWFHLPQILMEKFCENRHVIMNWQDCITLIFNQCTPWAWLGSTELSPPKECWDMLISNSSVPVLIGCSVCAFSERKLEKYLEFLLVYTHPNIHTNDTSLANQIMFVYTSRHFMVICDYHLFATHYNRWNETFCNIAADLCKNDFQCSLEIRYIA